MINIYEKIGNYALDISKYVVTGFVLTAMFSDIDAGSSEMYIIAISVAIAFIVIAVWAFNKQNDKEEKQNKKKGGKK